MKDVKMKNELGFKFWLAIVCLIAVMTLGIMIIVI